MSYKHNFEKRYNQSLKSEKHFEKVCQDNDVYYKSFGIEKAKYSLHNHYYLDYRLQCQPDYQAYLNDDLKFIEVKTFGNPLKIKEYDLEAYRHWNIFNELLFFISYNYEKDYLIVSFNKIYNLIKNKLKKYYPDNEKIYYEFTLEELKKL